MCIIHITCIITSTLTYLGVIYEKTLVQIQRKLHNKLSTITNYLTIVY